MLSIKSTSKKFSWWILAFLQFIFLVAFVKSLFGVTNGTVLGFLCLLGFASVSCALWLEIGVFFNKIQNKMVIREFFSLSVNFALVFLVFFALAMVLRQIGLPIGVFELFASIIFSTAIVLLVNLVIFKLKVLSAFGIAMDVWRKQFYLALSFSVSIFILFALCIFLAQEVLVSYFLGEFSVFKASATIWLFGLASIVGIAFVLALFNCFWVLCILEKIRPLKTKELSKTEVSITAPEAVM
jgi:hypothetical protein